MEYSMFSEDEGWYQKGWIPVDGGMFTRAIGIGRHGGYSPDSFQFSHWP